ncbi:MAG: hypothetical protein LBK95_20690 [Bifidobacteriaceae bacterium]|nr:hypothetical protein [Bifidobacteriaceae bacterium]
MNVELTDGHPGGDQPDLLDRRLEQFRNDAMRALAGHSSDAYVRDAAQEVIDGSLSVSQFVSLPRVSETVMEGLNAFRKRLQVLTPEEAQEMRAVLIREAEAVGASPYAAMRIMSELQDTDADALEVEP